MRYQLIFLVFFSLIFSMDDSKVGVNPYEKKLSDINRQLKKTNKVKTDLNRLKRLSHGDNIIRTGIRSDFSIAVSELKAIEGLLLLISNIRSNEINAIRNNSCSYNATDLYLNSLDIVNDRMKNHLESITLRLNLLDIWEYESNLKSEKLLRSIALIRDFYKTTIRVLS